MKIIESTGIVIDSQDGGVCLSNGRPYWDQAFQRAVRKFLGDFCPEVDVEGNVGYGAPNFEATFKIRDSEGREICGTSKSIAEKGVKIPEKELSLFLSKLSEFHKSADSEDVRNLGDIQDFIRNFKVPDPQLMKDAWRVSQTKERRLIVLWGYYDKNGGANSVVLPWTEQSQKFNDSNSGARIDIAERVPVLPKPSRPWWMKWLLSLLVLLALPFLLSLYVFIATSLFGVDSVPAWMWDFHPRAIHHRFFADDVPPKQDMPEMLSPDNLLTISTSFFIRKTGETNIVDGINCVCRPQFDLMYKRQRVNQNDDLDLVVDAKWIDIEIMANGTVVDTNYSAGVKYKPTYELKNGHINRHIIVVRGSWWYKNNQGRDGVAFETEPFRWHCAMQFPRVGAEDGGQPPKGDIPPVSAEKKNEDPGGTGGGVEESPDGLSTNVPPETSFNGSETNIPPVVSSPKNEDGPMSNLEPKFHVKLDGKDEYRKIRETSWEWVPKFQLYVSNVDQGAVEVNNDVEWIDVEYFPDGRAETNVVRGVGISYKPKPGYRVLKDGVNSHVVMARGCWGDSKNRNGVSHAFVTNPCRWGDDKRSPHGDMEDGYIPREMVNPPTDNENKNDTPNKGSQDVVPRNDEGKHSENGNTPREDGPLVCELHNEPFVNGECRVRCPVCKRHLDENRECPDVCSKHPEVHKSLNKGLCPKCDGEIIGEEKCWIDVQNSPLQDAPWNVRFSLWSEEGKEESVSWIHRIGDKYEVDLGVGSEVDAVRIIKAFVGKYGKVTGVDTLAQPHHITGSRKIVVDGRQIVKKASVIWKMSFDEKEKDGIERHIRLCGKKTDDKGNSYFMFRMYSNPHDSSAKTKAWTIRLAKDVVDGKQWEEENIPCHIEKEISNAIRLYTKDIPRNGRLKVVADVTAGGKSVRNIEGNFIFQAGAITASSSFNRELVERAGVMADMMCRSIPLVRTSSGWGTAFAISKKWLLTNEHVVKGDENKTIFLRIPGGGSGNAEIKAKVVKMDSENDLALLEVIDGYEFKNPLRLGSGKARVGENVSVLGYPYDANQQFAHAEGRISKVFDAKIAHEGVVWNGNSGGPLVSVETGEVLGVTNAYAYKDKNGERYALASIAIPADVARRFVYGR